MFSNLSFAVLLITSHLVIKFILNISPLAPSLPSGRLFITFSPHIDPGLDLPISILVLLLRGLQEEEEATSRSLAQ